MFDYVYAEKSVNSSVNKKFKKVPLQVRFMAWASLEQQFILFHMPLAFGWVYWDF